MIIFLNSLGRDTSFGSVFRAQMYSQLRFWSSAVRIQSYTLAVNFCFVMKWGWDRSTCWFCVQNMAVVRLSLISVRDLNVSIPVLQVLLPQIL